MASNSRVVLDSNVIISALISSGRSREFIFELLRDDVEIILSDYILSEIKEVLLRKRFREKEVLKTLFDRLVREAKIVKFSFKTTKTRLRDPKDHPILLTAQEGKAGFIITGDEDLLSLKLWRGIKIIKMTDYSRASS